MVASERIRVCVCALLLAFSSLCGGAAGQEDGSLPVIVDATATPLDSKLAFERVVVGANGVARPAFTLPSPEGRGDTEAENGSVAGAAERLIYSNTLGIHGINFPTNQPVSDDIATTAPNGCALTRYRFKVLGKVLPTGLSGAYTVTYGLYSNCPLAVGSNNATRDLVRIPGTEGTLDFPDDGPRLIEHIVPAGTPVELPTNVYLGLRFNRGNCGTVIGAPASIGYSGDIWDFPGFPCNGFLGGFPERPHASFWLEMFGSENCSNAFVGYKAQRPSGGTATLGAGIQGVDDVKLFVNDCQMVGYEVVVRGVGFYNFDLRRNCDGQIIAGTERTFQLNANTVPLLQVARFTFNPPIALTTDSLYVGFKCSSNSAGAVVAGILPIVGSNETDYFTIGVDGCAPVMPTTGVHGAINFAITCAGKLSLGACCDPYLTECQGGPDAGARCRCNAICAGGVDEGDCCSPSSPCDPPGNCEPVCAAPGTCEAVCRETTELNCSFPLPDSDFRPQWNQGEACEPDPFLPDSCGVAACCHLRPNPQNPNILDEVCVNMTKNECEAQLQEPTPPIWQLGEYCGLNAQRCPINACLGRDNCICYMSPCPCDPCYPDFPPDQTCCNDVCSNVDPYCCEVLWDDRCCELAEEMCAPLGACCDWVNTDANGEPVCRNVPLSECPQRPGGDPPQWIEGMGCESEPFDPPCGKAACCHYRTDPSSGQLEQACANLTKPECTTASPAGKSFLWQAGNVCGQDFQSCPNLACVGTTESCFSSHATPGCCDTFCCRHVCSLGATGRFCCEVAWDSACVALLHTNCSVAPLNDTCAPNPDIQCPNGAEPVPVPGSITRSNSGVTTTSDEPGFCCHNGVSQCMGGVHHGLPCTLDYECPGGLCPARTPMPGAKGYGTMWFKFVQPSGTTSAGINVCGDEFSALDSIMQVYAVGDNSSPIAACHSLSMIGCNDDASGCGYTQRNSRACLRGLTSGSTYYVMVAAKTPSQLGSYTVAISTSCSGTTPSCTNCPAGEMEFIDPPNNVVDARRPHKPSNPQSAEGIKMIVANGPSGATKDCWSVCQAPEVPASIQITSIEESPLGTYTIQLNRPIGVGAVTLLSYTDKDLHRTVGRFVAHPANANADGYASATDILAMVDHLNGVQLLPWGQYSEDLDHSGVIGPADIITLIDLLNGNGYAAWYGTALPDAEGCP
jgi:hypothetical protein